MMRYFLASVCVALAGLQPVAAAQEAPPQPVAQVPIAVAAWLAGDWVGDGFGGRLEENWSAPAGRQMIGHFRMVENGAPQFYELVLIEEHEGGLRYRVKHFNPDYTGWEERSDAHTFAFVSASADELRFEGLIVRRTGPDTSDHILTMRRNDGHEETVVLHYRRP